MFGSKSNINNFFALETSTHKILRLLPSTRIPTRQNLGAWMRNHSIVNQERIRIREYHKFLSKLIPIQISKILSFVMVLHIKFYLKKSLINFILIILFDFVFQDICYPFYISNGLCNYIFYFLLVSRKFKNNLFFLYYAYDSFGNIGVDFLICIPLELINFPMIMRSTHAQFKQSQATCLSRSKEWNTCLENHEGFTAFGKISLLYATLPENAFALGVKSLPRNSLPRRIFWNR